MDDSKEKPKPAPWKLILAATLIAVIGVLVLLLTREPLPAATPEKPEAAVPPAPITVQKDGEQTEQK